MADDDRIKGLPENVARVITNAQVVISLAGACRELIDNSIDAGATSIEIRLKEHGVEQIEVIDNGKGIDEADFDALAQPHCTSKIRSMTDFDSLHSFGFRGEALNALTTFSKVNITTKSRSAKVATKLTFDTSSTITNKQVVAGNVGTVVSVGELFFTLPVRRHELKKNYKKEFIKVVETIQAFALARPDVKFVCSNFVKGRKTIVLTTPGGTATLRDAIATIFGSKDQKDAFREIVPTLPDAKTKQHFGLAVDGNRIFEAVDIFGYVSSVLPNFGSHSADRQFLFVNNRHVDHPTATKVINEVYKAHNKNKFPIIVLFLKVHPSRINVNITPDKRTVQLRDESVFLAKLKASLERTFDEQKSEIGVTNVKEVRGVLHSPSKKVTDFAVKLSLSQVETAENDSVPETSIRDRLPKPEFIDNLAVNVPPANPASDDFANRPQKRPRILAETSDNEGRSPKQLKPSSNDSPGDGGMFRFLRSTPIQRTNAANVSIARNALNSSLAEDLPISPSTSTAVIISGGERTPATSEIHSPQKISPKEMRQRMVSASQESKQDRIHEGRTESDSNLDADIEIIVENAMEVHRQFGYGNVIFEKSQNADNESANEHDDPVFEDDKDAETTEQEVVEMNPVDRLLKKLPLWFYGYRAQESGDHYRLTQVSNDTMTSVDFQGYLKHISSFLNCDQNDENCSAHDQEVIQVFGSNKIADELSTQVSLKKTDFMKMRVLWQFNKSFMFCILDRKLFVVDQHAADEKYNYEQLMFNTQLKRQPLLRPVPISLTAGQEAIVRENLNIFKQNGFEFEFKKSAEKRVAIIGVPALMDRHLGKEEIDEIIAHLAVAPGRPYRPEKMQKIFASKACRKSVMVGDQLEVKRMQQIVHHLAALVNPWNCPHGRPTVRLINCHLPPTRKQPFEAHVLQRLRQQIAEFNQSC